MTGVQTCALPIYPIEGKFICHCSGVMTAKDAFPDIVQKHGYGYSVHPLFAVSDKFKAYKELPDVFFAIEGAKEKLADIMNILDKSGLKARHSSLESSSEKISSIFVLITPEPLLIICMNASCSPCKSLK